MLVQSAFRIYSHFHKHPLLAFHSNDALLFNMLEAVPIRYAWFAKCFTMLSVPIFTSRSPLMFCAKQAPVLVND